MLQVTQGESGSEVSGEFDLLFVGIRALMVILTVIADGTHKDVGRLK
jgi:hypothetical protein